MTRAGSASCSAPRSATCGAVRREFVFRLGTPEEFADFFRANYGPTLKAFKAELARTHNRATDATIRIPGEYLEVVAQRTPDPA
ncbi:hypothetical protein ACQP0U_31230 [Micromonospora sp. CA-269861]|uniref:hypothetical protein n=1 Tax=Micromonospora sp. CA-269861 TaxID=3239968 RepID=UPI003D90E411